MYVLEWQELSFRMGLALETLNYIFKTCYIGSLVTSSIPRREEKSTSIIRSHYVPKIFLIRITSNR